MVSMSNDTANELGRCRYAIFFYIRTIKKLSEETRCVRFESKLEKS